MTCEITPLDYHGDVVVRFCSTQPNTPRYIPRLKDYVSHTEYLGYETPSDSGPISIEGEGKYSVNHVRFVMPYLPGLSR